MTRGEISDALQALNATNTKDRAAAIRAMFLPKYAPHLVERVVADLKSYPEWAARMDLEDGVTAIPPSSAPADPAPGQPASEKKKRG